jgi:NAD(P)-dependent dehydrogenase (short-subunit alcohol dehydrogenase family)
MNNQEQMRPKNQAPMQLPGKEDEMQPKSHTEGHTYRASGKLEGKVALITGGDSGIGKAVAIAFAKEGADVAIIYLSEHEDAQKTIQLIEAEGRKCLALSGDVGDRAFCESSVQEVVDKLGSLDILVNNAAEQHPQENFEDISAEQLEQTFRTNFFGYFYLTKAALPHLREGSAIINTASVVAYKGNQQLIDYASTKGAIVAFTRSLALNLAERGIRVNGVAPGPIWTPLIPSTFPKEKAENFGKDTPLGRPGQPEEVAPSFVFLASDDASYFTGQFLHPNGGEVVNA